MHFERTLLELTITHFWRHHVDKHFTECPVIVEKQITTTIYSASGIYCYYRLIVGVIYINHKHQLVVDVIRLYKLFSLFYTIGCRQCDKLSPFLCTKCYNNHPLLVFKMIRCFVSVNV